MKFKVNIMQIRLNYIKILIFKNIKPGINVKLKCVYIFFGIKTILI